MKRRLSRRGRVFTLLVAALWPVMAVTAQLSSEETRPYEQHALTHSGDVRRGRELFLDQKLTKCAVCHKLDGQGGEAGPDLSAIGGKFDRPHLIESLLEPSRQIVEGFRSTVCVLDSGRVVTGVVRDESEQMITLIGVDGRRSIAAGTCSPTTSTAGLSCSI